MRKQKINIMLKNKTKISKQWAEYAKSDFDSAQVLLNGKQYKECAWHCHQSIEKLLKEILIKQNKRPRKIHDLTELLREAKITLPAELLNLLEELNFHYLPSRYPDFYEQIKKLYSFKNIKNVLELTRTLFLWLKNYLNQN